MQLDIPKKKIREAFALSKTIVVNEQNLKDQALYNKISYLEFLEFICRISDVWLEATEMEELPRYRKIEYFLEIMLPLTN